MKNDDIFDKIARDAYNVYPKFVTEPLIKAIARSKDISIAEAVDMIAVLTPGCVVLTTNGYKQLSVYKKDYAAPEPDASASNKASPAGET